MKEKKCESSLCEKHGEKLLAYCMLCKGSEEPMCAICLCEHNDIKHFKGNASFKALTEERFEKLREEEKKQEAHNKVLAEYVEKAQELAVVKGQLAKEIGKVIDTIKEVAQKQSMKVSLMDSDVTKKIAMFTRALWKERCGIRSSLCRAQGMEQEVQKEMMSKNYQKALQLLNGYKKEEIDDTELKQSFHDYEDAIEQYKKFKEELHNAMTTGMPACLKAVEMSERKMQALIGTQTITRAIVDEIAMLKRATDERAQAIEKERTGNVLLIT